MNALMDRYAGYVLPALSYGTVRDFCDSVDNFGLIADLRSYFRHWTKGKEITERALRRGGLSVAHLFDDVVTKK